MNGERCTRVSPRHHDALRAIGVTPIDYRADVAAQVCAVAPSGVDAVFDHIGGAGIATSWGLLAPNGRHAYFYNIWAGRPTRPAAFRARLREDLTTVLEALADGRLTAQVAARLPLTSVAEAVRLAESGRVAGKVVLTPRRPGFSAPGFSAPATNAEKLRYHTK